MKIRFALIGYGWRADIYKRIAQLHPEKFELTAQLLRTEARAKEIRDKDGIFTTHLLEEALETAPSFVVLCVPKPIARDYTIRLMELGIPVLCETTPDISVEGLNQLWKKYQELDGQVQVAEQYFMQPYYAGVLEVIRRGYLGDVSHAMLSAIHGYHAISIFRKILGVQMDTCRIQGRRFTYDVTDTCGREGFDTSGTVKEACRDWVTLEFENGKTAFFDFSGEQYFSPIRRRRWNVQGVRGEINDNQVCFLNKDNIPMEQEMKRVDVGINNISEWSHKCMTFLEDYIYENPFYPARMNDDEIAVASCLEKMHEYVESGVEFYPLREALQDAYLDLKMEEALESGEVIRTEYQSW